MFEARSRKFRTLNTYVTTAVAVAGQGTPFSTLGLITGFARVYIQNKGCEYMAWKASHSRTSLDISLASIVAIDRHVFLVNGCQYRI